MTNAGTRRISKMQLTTGARARRRPWLAPARTTTVSQQRAPTKGTAGSGAEPVRAGMGRGKGRGGTDILQALEVAAQGLHPAALVRERILHVGKLGRHLKAGPKDSNVSTAKAARRGPGKPSLLNRNSVSSRMKRVLDGSTVSKNKHAGSFLLSLHPVSGSGHFGDWGV